MSQVAKIKTGDAVPARAAPADAAEPVPVSGKAGIAIATNWFTNYERERETNRKLFRLLDTALFTIEGEIARRNWHGMDTAALTAWTKRAREEALS